MDYDVLFGLQHGAGEGSFSQPLREKLI